MLPFVRFILLFSGLFFISHSSHTQGRCGSDLLNRESGTAVRSSEAWRGYQQAGALAKTTGISPDSIYTIPVVVHVLHTGDPVGTAFNPTDATIDSAIAFLNGSLGAIWPELPDATQGGVPVPLRFVLAKRGPDCRPTTGINRVDGRQFDNYEREGVRYVSDANFQAIMDRVGWPQDQYYNIYIVNYIDGPAGMYAGFAYYPGDPSHDATFILASHLERHPQTGQYSVILPHEIGHAFDLRHTFEGADDTATCPVNADCRVDGDGICDTEPHRRIAPGEPCPWGENPCTGTAYMGSSQNIMNYSSCADRFTPGQRERMLHALRNYRMNLVYSRAHLPPQADDAELREAACSPILSGMYAGAGIRYLSLGDVRHDNVVDSFGPSGYRDRSCLRQVAELLSGTDYELRLAGGVASQRQQAWIDYDDDGAFGPEEALLPEGVLRPGEELTTRLRIPEAGAVTTGRLLRMRVLAVCDTCAGGKLQPCEEGMAGYAEDFAVRIRPRDAAIDYASLYPNPARRTVVVQTLVPAQLSVYAVSGKLLLHTQANTIDVSGFASGLYFVRVSETGSPERSRVLKLEVL